ncbi:MAG: hypothetical protein SFY96_09545 [Planctomycetota bacterium]|nr:hypothetical protein [Planctomycetota bacterium]
MTNDADNPDSPPSQPAIASESVRPAEVTPSETAEVAEAREPAPDEFIDETVPALPKDKWAHRRGEPRVFALMWTMFLLVATMGMLGGVLAGGVISYDVYRPAARILLIIAMVGIAILWPMARLSQVRPTETPIAAAFKDIVVILVPLQAVIWPQHWLAAWAWQPLAALGAAMIAWVLLLGGVLALAMQGLAPKGEHVPRQEGTRTAWMSAIVFMSVAALVVRLASPGERAGTDERWSDVLGVLSPIGAVVELCHDRAWSGSAIAVSPAHWIGIGIVALAAVSLWLIAWGAARGDRAAT